MSEQLRYPEAAAYLGISPKTLRRLVRQRKIRCFRLSERVVQFSKADLIAYREKTSNIQTP
jgi:excisionase family DNA binding protein